MRIAFLGHSYHRTTGSSAFFLDLLERRGTVEVFWDEAWNGGPPIDVEAIAGGGFDAIVVWQVETIAPRVARLGHPNVTFVPMYDGCHAFQDAYWTGMGGAKVLCFSSTLNERLQRLGVHSRYVQYFPPVDPDRRADHGAGLKGFFWQRQQDVTWRTVRPLLGDARFAQFTLHRALDPSFGEFVEPSAEEVERFSIRTTAWHATPRAAAEDLARHNVYFAPRVREGIGMSFLEAMAMGALVVAPDQPTMNEYVVPGVNGLLYDPFAPAPLDYSSHEELGRRARRSAELGRAKWLRSVERVLHYVLSPAAELPRSAPRDALDPWACEGGVVQGRRRAADRPPRALEGGRRLGGAVGASRSPATPMVTVVVVTKNASQTLGPTLESILQQDHPSRELIVFDGASTDGTVGILRDHDAEIDLWRSAADGGPYEAMNAAVSAAAGRYVVFMNAGDHFQSRDALSLALDGAPDDADVIFGHHVYRHVDGFDELHRAAPFQETWQRLRDGEVGWDWLAGVPGHQATLVRTELLRRNPFRTRYRIAADHDLLYRLAAQGSRFHHCGGVLATYVGGGLSWQNQGRCFEEWRQIALEHTGRPEAAAPRLQVMGVDARRGALASMKTSTLLAESLRHGDARAALFARMRAPISRLLKRRPRLRKRRVIELGSPDLGRHVLLCTGLSAAEGWGRWTDGARVVLELSRIVKRPARVRLHLFEVFGPNVGQTLVVRLGQQEHRLRLGAGRQVLTIRIPRRLRAPFHRLELEVPAPASPRALGGGSDGRLLGVALRRIDVESGRW